MEVEACPGVEVEVEVVMESNEGKKKKLDKRLLLLPLLPLLLIPPVVAGLGGRFLKRRKERAAVKALASRLVEERRAARKGGRAGKAAVKPKVKVNVREGAKSRLSAVSQVRNLFGRRMIKFLLMALAERVIAAQRARMKDSLPPIPLAGRLSKAKDI